MKRPHVFNYLVGLFVAAVLLAPASGQAAGFDYDISVQNTAISFSPAQFYAGDSVRIYGQVTNSGNKDITGYVAFYQGVNIIGDPQFFSSKAQGASEDFWVDWVAIEGTYNFALRVMQSSPQDQDALNNQNISPMMTIAVRPVPPAPPTILTPTSSASVTTSKTSATTGTTPSSPTTPSKASNAPTTPTAPTPPATTLTQETSNVPFLADNAPSPLSVNADDIPLANEGDTINTITSSETSSDPQETSNPARSSNAGSMLLGAALIAILLFTGGLILYKKSGRQEGEEDLTLQGE